MLAKKNVFRRSRHKNARNPNQAELKTIHRKIAELFRRGEKYKNTFQMIE